MKSVLIIGMGKLGMNLALNMQNLGNQVMIVDRDEQRIAPIQSSFTDILIGDCTNRDVVKSIGVNNFDICFVMIGSNFQSSLITTFMLKELGAKYIVAKSKERVQEKLLYSIGADEVICPEMELSEKLAIRYNTNNIFDYIPLTEKHSIFEVEMPTHWVGRSIEEIQIRKKFNANIIAIKNGESIELSPSGNYVFNADDRLVVLGQTRDVFKIAAMN